jgi:hypothetical protein
VSLLIGLTLLALGLAIGVIAVILYVIRPKGQHR